MRNRLSILLLMFAFGMTACFEDDSSFGTVEVGEIEISGLPENASIISYNGNILRATPDVKHGYAESEMNYAYYIYGGALEEKRDFRAYRIDENGEKDLAYEVNLPSGSYTIVFEATAPNSYAQTATFPLTVSTPFSQGFYILKETADGNTELDLLTDDGLVGNLMTSLLGSPLAGKPLGLSVIYNYGYIDETDQQMKADNMVHVFTEQDYRGFRTEDMFQTFSRNSLMFEDMPEGETFCAAMMDMNGVIFLSDKGFYRSRTGISSGKLGVPDIEGGSKFIQSLSAGMTATLFWNEKTHGISDMSEGDMRGNYELPAGIHNEDLECLASGLNYAVSGDIAWFLCMEQKSGKRLLFSCEAVPFVELFPGYWLYDIDIQVQLVPEDKHLATGNVFAGNGLEASIIYVVDNNKLYLYDLKTGMETPFILRGLNGEITYISNNFLNIYDYSGISQNGNFNYLVVATRTGEGYNLYFYDNLVGGVPSGEAVRTIGGTGTVTGIRYLSTTLTSDNWSIWNYYGPLYPYGD